MAILLEDPVPGPFDGSWRFPQGMDFPEAFKIETESISKLFVVSNQSALGNTPVGFIVQFPAGDGKAMYRVEKAQPLQVRHIPYGDAYQVHPAMLRGLTLDDVRQQMEWERFWLSKRGQAGQSAS